MVLNGVEWYLLLYLYSKLNIMKSNKPEKRVKMDIRIRSLPAGIADKLLQDADKNKRTQPNEVEYLITKALLQCK